MQSEARTYLLALDKQLSQKCYESSLAEWDYATNINEENLESFSATRSYLENRNDPEDSFINTEISSINFIDTLNSLVKCPFKSKN